MTKNWYIGIASHTLTAVALWYFSAPIWLWATWAYFLKEWGEQKYKIKGPIAEKRGKMLKAVFSPKVLPQWVLPGAAVFVLERIAAKVPSVAAIGGI